MQVQFYQTQNDLLKPFLEGFYFLSQQRGEEDVEYLTFPNNLISVSVYRNATVELKNHHALISENQNQAFFSVLVSNYKTPIKALYRGEINELTFSFKPLGLNAFLTDPSSYYKQLIQCFNPFEDYEETMLSIFEEEDTDLKFSKVENYWLSKLNGFHHPLVELLINELQKRDDEISIEQLARKYNTSRQNINKLFNKYLGKSPADFRKIHRFRETLTNRIATLKKEGSLTSLSYESLFYDQSHMVKEFKMLTGLTPKKFFENIQLKAGAGNWLFSG